MAVLDNDIIRVACKMRFLGAADIINVWHFNYITGGSRDEADCVIDVQEFMSDAYIVLVGSLPPEVSFTDMSIQNLSQNTIVGSGAWIGLTVGGGGADAMPPQVANLVIFPTQIPRAQGRKYLPAFTESLYDNGVLTAGAVGLCNTFGNFFVGVQTMLSGTVQFGTYSDAPAHFYSLISRRVIPALRTQRRRTVGFGS
jgi:hypothetical protein